MSKQVKPVECLTVADLRAWPVWQYTNRDASGETLVGPVKRIPVATLAGKEVGVQVQLSNRNEVWALIGNVDVHDPRLTEHFLTLSVERDRKWFSLARYHDFDYCERGPDALAAFLDLPVDEVFPISYDIRRYVQGDPAALSGKIFKEPRERLTRSEIIALAVPKP